MDLILWRHAEAVEGRGDSDDLLRALTPRGEKQAARMAAWLDRQLPDSTRIWVSPARRTEQTALALGRKFKLNPVIAPMGTADQLLELGRQSSNCFTFVGFERIGMRCQERSGMVAALP
jgi:phosphohistidine phosphatase